MNSADPTHPSRLRHFLRLGIRQKVVLILVATLFVTLTVNSWLALQAQEREVLNETERRGAEIAHFIGQYLAYSVISYDYHTIELLLADLIKNEDIVYAKAISARGNTMAEIGSPPAAADNLVMFQEQMRLNDEGVGTLLLGLSTERIIRHLEEERQASIFRQLVVIFTIMAVEFLALSYIIIRPITRISRVVTAGIGSDGKVMRALPVESKDEFGEMAKQFNRLHDELNAAHRTLQSQVELADTELKHANALLIAQAEDLRGMNRELELLAVTDPMTGLYNRRYFKKLMDDEVGLSIRNNETNSIILIDIDHFKRYNDRHGHNIGDNIIREVAHIIQSRIRRTDVACRYGGDEFFILCRRATPANATTIADELHRAITERPLEINGLKIPLTLSIGIATIPGVQAITTVEEFFRCADLALYHSKHAGRNRVTHFSMLDKHQRVHPF